MKIYRCSIYSIIFAICSSRPNHDFLFLAMINFKTWLFYDEF